MMLILSYFFPLSTQFKGRKWGMGDEKSKKKRKTCPYVKVISANVVISIRKTL